MKKNVIIAPNESPLEGRKILSQYLHESRLAED